MSLFFGTDNPYRAPTVARDVAEYQGVIQEQVYTPEVKSTAMDFFYQGAQSFQQNFQMMKNHYESEANKAMAEIEEQKAQDILNGLTTEEVNRNHRDRYNALAESGTINKNLDARQVFNRNMVGAHGAVTGDVAQDQLDALNAELAKGGYSYVESQEIVKKYRQRWQGTQVGDALEAGLNRIDNQAKAAEREDKFTQFQQETALAAQGDIFPQNATPESRSAAWDVLRGDPKNPVILNDDDGSVSLSAIQSTGEQFYQSHYKKHVDGLPPAQQAYAEEMFRRQALNDARVFTAQLNEDRIGRRREAENVSQINSIGTNAIRMGSDEINAAIPTEVQALGMTVDSFRQESLATGLKAINRGASADILGLGWDPTNKNGVFNIIMSEATTIEEMDNLLASFPPEDFNQAQNLGYVFDNETPMAWSERRAAMLQKVQPVMSARVGAMSQVALQRHQQVLTGQMASGDPNAMKQAADGYMRRYQALQQQIDSYGDRIGGYQGYTDEVALSMMAGTDNPAMNPLIEARDKMDDMYWTDLSGRQGKSGPELKEADITKAIKDARMATGQTPQDLAAMGIQLANSRDIPGMFMTDPNVAGDLDARGSAMVTGDLQGSINFIAQQQMIVNRQPDGTPNMFRRSASILSSEAFRAASAPDAPVGQRNAASGMLDVSVGLDMINHPLTYNQRGGIGDNHQDALKSKVSENAGEWLGLSEDSEGNLEYATLAYQTALDNAEGPLTERERRAKAMQTLTQLYGPKRARTIAQGYEIGNSVGFKEQDGFFGGATVAGEVEDESGRMVPLIDLVSSRADDANRRARMQNNLQILSASIPDLAATGGVVTNAAEAMRMAISPTGDDPTGPFAVLGGSLVEDSNFFSADTIYETLARNYGVRDESNRIQNVAIRHLDTIAKDPVISNQFDYYFTEYMGTHDHASINADGDPEVTAGFLQQASEYALNKIDEQYHFDGFQLLDRSNGANEAAIDSSTWFNGWQQSYWDDIEGGNALPEWMSSKDTEQGWQMATSVLTADTEAWIENGGLKDEDLQGMANDLFLSRDADGNTRGQFNFAEDGDWQMVGERAQKQGGRLQRSLAHANAMFGDWTVEGPDGPIAVMDLIYRNTNEDGSSEFDQQSLRDVEAFLDGRVDPGYFNNEGVLPWAGNSDAMEFTPGALLHASMYALARKQDRDISLSDVDGIVKDYGMTPESFSKFIPSASPDISVMQDRNSPTGLVIFFPGADGAGGIRIPLNLPRAAGEDSIPSWPGRFTPWWGRLENKKDPSLGNGLSYKVRSNLR